MMETNQKSLIENLKSPAVRGLQPFVDPVKDLRLRKDLGGNSWFKGIYKGKETTRLLLCGAGGPMGLKLQGRLLKSAL